MSACCRTGGRQITGTRNASFNAHLDGRPLQRVPNQLLTNQTVAKTRTPTLTTLTQGRMSGQHSPRVDV
jgi:hypothetical protein